VVPNGVWKAALLMQQNRTVLLALIPGAFCLSRNERRDASTGSRPLLRLDLYLNGALPATSTLTSTHRLSQCVGRTSRERERERERKEKECVLAKRTRWEKYQTEGKNLRFCEAKISPRYMICWRTWNIQTMFKREILFEKEGAVSFENSYINIEYTSANEKRELHS